MLHGLRPASGDVLCSQGERLRRPVRRLGRHVQRTEVGEHSRAGRRDSGLIDARRTVSRALVELQEYALSRGRGGSEWVVAGNVVAASFDHIAARPVTGVEDGYGRPPPPHPLVIANMTRRPDGQWRGIDPIEIYRAQAFATAVYRSELARQAQQLGYGLWIAGRDGRWELFGIRAST